MTHDPRILEPTKMGDLSLICPLCCNKIFNSKEALIEHLSSIIPNLFCPVCNSKVTSIEQLSEHLSLDNCSPIDTVQTIVFDNSVNNDYASGNSVAMDYKHVDDDNTNNIANTNNNYAHIDILDAGDVNKMQIDLMKCLQTQELKFVKEAEHNRYIIVSGEQPELNEEDVETNEIKDGTVLSTSVNDIKNEVSEMLEQSKDEEHTVVQEYSCSTCQMSFTSVIDHINNYHTDQDVVVEGNIGNMSTALPEMEYETPEKETPIAEGQTSRRIITDTGAIVETPIPIVVKATSAGKLQPKNEATTNTQPAKTPKVAAAEKPKRGKRYIKIDKLCDSVIRDLKSDIKGSGSSHKVVVAPSVLTTDGEPLKMYQCTNCDLYESDLAEFRLQACTKAPKYRCAQCPLTYDNSKSLCAHMKAHKAAAAIANGIPKSSETFECEICCTVLLTSKSLKLHKRMHGPIKERTIGAPGDLLTEQRFQCEICDKMIPEDYRAIHIASHKSDKMLNCSICNKKFTSPEFLEMHMNVHNLDKLAPSELAEEHRGSEDEWRPNYFTSEEDGTRHFVPTKQSKSNKYMPYSCVYCDRKFARPHEKVKHERIHTGEKPHECVICGKSFRVSYCLTLHMRTHTGARPYACPHCHKRFKAHSVFNHHLLTHSDVRAYKCPFCPKAFKTSVQLAGHKNSHTKPFSCTHCNRPFASLYAVRNHTETHNRQNSLKYRCSLCGACYARAFALKDHLKQVHNQEVGSIDPFTGHADDWVLKPISDDKDLSEEITNLDLPSDEYIVPN